MKKGSWISIGIAALVLASLLVALWPRVEIEAKGTISISLERAYAESEFTPAYAHLIPNGVGDETGLQVFPPKLQVGGKGNWLAVQSPNELNVTYVYGSGSDLYQLENPARRTDTPVAAVSIYAYVRAQAGATKATAATRIETNSKKYNGVVYSLAEAEQRISMEYTLNPATGSPFTWEEIDNLQAGVTLKDAICRYIEVRVESVVRSQTFFPVDPIECTPGATGWQDVDLDSYISGLGSDVTGVILHIVNTYTALYAFGLRKNGSTDNRTTAFYNLSHCWAAIGVDSDHIFEVDVGSTTYIDVYIVGYTKTGVTFFTNAYDKSLTATGAWTDISCATEAPGATGLIFEVVSSALYAMGLRENGSSDNRTNAVSYHQNFGWIIGCDTSQVCEGYIGNVAVDFYLVGYITDGATFNTNATDLSLSSTGSWLDLSALPSTSVMGFIEIAGAGYYCGLRKNGSSEDIYRYAQKHPCAFVECDASYIIEGKIANVAVDFWLLGYATTVAGEPDITVSPTSYDFGIVAESSTPSTTTTYFTIDNNSTIQTDQTIGVTTSTWSGGWTHNDSGSSGSNAAALLANRGGTWGSGDIIVKYSSPSYIYENCPASTDYSFGLKLLAPTSFDDGNLNQITVRITAVAG